MTDATTPNYGWSIPTNGADDDTWGTTLNTTLIAIDAQVAANAAAAGVPASGGTFTGAVVFNGNVTVNSNPTHAMKGGYQFYADTGFVGGETTVSTGAPTGTPANGDRWLQHA